MTKTDLKRREAFLTCLFYVHVDVNVCTERLKVLNKCLPGFSPEEVEGRCEKVDRFNAMTIERSMKFANIVVYSL